MGRGASLGAPSVASLFLCATVLFCSPLCNSISIISSNLARFPMSLQASPASLGAATGPLRLRGGGLPFRYVDGWNEITIKMPIAENIKARDIVYNLTP
jgi:hypothetical protein